MLGATRGSVPPYGIAISDALADPATSLERLKDLRASARSHLEQQGDLAGALTRLDEEIQRRRG